jgi:NAD(P)-dependent dehydrogenase (short-subunit alcohol dehydrogenase family)
MAAMRVKPNRKDRQAMLSPQLTVVSGPVKNSVARIVRQPPAPKTVISPFNRDRAELVALRRLGTVEDCAEVVEFLATDLSDYVTGAVIPIDGGLVRG